MLLVIVIQFLHKIWFEGLNYFSKYLKDVAALTQPIDFLFLISQKNYR